MILQPRFSPRQTVALHIGSLVKKILHKCCAMMLFNKINQRVWQMVLASQVGSIFDVTDDNQVLMAGARFSCRFNSPAVMFSTKYWV